jgi:ComF family protein
MRVRRPQPAQWPMTVRQWRQNCQPRWMRAVYQSLDRLQFALLPGHCLLCAMGSNRPLDLCAPCEAELPWITHGCRRCALPLPAAELLCGRCQAQEPPFSQVVAPLAFAPPLDQLLRDWKQQPQPALGRLFADLLASHLRVGRLASAPPPELLLPVPSHPRRLRQRGFNQAQELAVGLGRRLGIEVDCHLLKQRGSGVDQRQLDFKARQRNLRDAFVVKGLLAGRRVAVVDDVVTTGATAQAMSRVLRRAGAIEVEVWAVARTPRRG